MRIRTNITTAVTYCVLAVAGTVPILLPTHLVSPTARAAVLGDPIDLATTLGNCDFESDLGHSQWKVTRPTSQYLGVLPVNPAIEPLDPAYTNGTKLPALMTPVGYNFVGVLNPTNWDSLDLKGKLTHEAAARHAPVGTTFQVSVWGNRGRLATNTNTDPSFVEMPSTIMVEFCGWDAGSAPSDKGDGNWTRNPPVRIREQFTHWGACGQWSSQNFSFTAPIDLEFISFTIAGRNDRHDSYVAFDVASAAAPATASADGTLN